MNQRVGSCSICGGDVMGYRGAWLSVTPPPPDECSRCGAVSRSDVIEMVPCPSGRDNPHRRVLDATNVLYEYFVRPDTLSIGG